MGMKLYTVLKDPTSGWYCAGVLTCHDGFTSRAQGPDHTSSSNCSTRATSAVVGATSSRGPFKLSTRQACCSDNTLLRCSTRFCAAADAACSDANTVHALAAVGILASMSPVSSTNSGGLSLGSGSSIEKRVPGAVLLLPLPPKPCTTMNSTGEPNRATVADQGLSASWDTC
eukprot:GHUV01036596.1.p1 GENE.GHUV01036596.1~~GHUV01036596.1.p1  ORF type:complete len:172 (-),score=40.79 GHUV01036596.1:621-1136(-)